MVSLYFEVYNSCDSTGSLQKNLLDKADVRLNNPANVSKPDWRKSLSLKACTESRTFSVKIHRFCFHHPIPTSNAYKMAHGLP